MKQKEAFKVQKSRFVLQYADFFKEGTVGKDHLMSTLYLGYFSYKTQCDGSDNIDRNVFEHSKLNWGFSMSLFL